MQDQVRGITKTGVIALICGYFLYFLVFYLSNYIFYESVALLYIWLFVKRGAYLIFPLIAATVTLVSYSAIGKRALLGLVYLTLPRLLYTVIYFYLYFISERFDSVESILFGGLLALAEAVICYLLTLAALGLMLLIIKKKNSDGESLYRIIKKRTALDFKDPVSLALAAAAIISFLYLFLYEIVNTVGFIIDYGTSFTAGELIFTVFSYLFAVAMLILYYAVLSYTKNTLGERLPEDEG